MDLVAIAENERRQREEMEEDQWEDDRELNPEKYIRPMDYDALAHIRSTYL